MICTSSYEYCLQKDKAGSEVGTKHERTDAEATDLVGSTSKKPRLYDPIECTGPGVLLAAPWSAHEEAKKNSLEHPGRPLEFDLKNFGFDKHQTLVLKVMSIMLGCLLCTQ